LGEQASQLWERAERQLAARDRVGARAALEALLESEPGHVMARLRLAMLLTSAGEYRASVEQLLAVAAQGPADAELVLLVAGMLHRLGEVEAALAMIESPAMLSGASREQLLQLAQLAQQMDAVAASGALLARAEAGLAAAPASAYLRATLQTFHGELDAAEASLAQCLGLAPGYAPALWSLARLRRVDAQHNHVAGLRRQLQQARDPGAQAYLGFALFKELDELGDHGAAWDALAAGCVAKRSTLAYDAAAEEAAFTRLHALDLGASTVVDDGAQPIFIVGLPRTGTTLLERILGGSGQVHNAGELDEFPLQLRWLADRFSKSYLDAGVFGAAARGDMAELGRRYLAHARWRAGGKRWFTDKLPLNFLNLGFIAAALPGARILHLVRDPMDACFSNLKELFADAYPYSYRLDELAAHYARYRRLMAHWHAVLPGRIHDVSYEALVTSPEAVARGVFGFCGLPWDAASLDLSRGGAVSTASTVQVREGIHARRVGAWQPYAGGLEPLRLQLCKDGLL
jgi:hypothetical protein